MFVGPFRADVRHQRNADFPHPTEHRGGMTVSDPVRYDGPLTVTGLIRLLRSLPGDHLVILASDAEGNRLSPASPDVGEGMYQDLIGGTGQMYPCPEELEHDAELRALYPGGIPADSRAALFLYPTA
jgi:hypothetical protein